MVWMWILERTPTRNVVKSEGLSWSFFESRQLYLSGAWFGCGYKNEHKKKMYSNVRVFQGHFLKANNYI
jgi:hypothetical protein